jgi:hypothetical protein
MLNFLSVSLGEKFGGIVDINKPVPLTVLEQSSLADITAE